LMPYYQWLERSVIVTLKGSFARQL
jgi:hypothetical protein